MIRQLCRMLREAGLSSGFIGKAIEEYKAEEAQLHSVCAEEQKALKGRWLGESDASEREFHRSLERIPAADRLGRRGTWGAYDLDEAHLWADYKSGLKGARITHKSSELKKIMEIIGRAVSLMREDLKGRDVEEEHFGEQYKLVAFDVDGTLVDTGGHAYVWNVLNEAFGTDDEDWEFQKEYIDGKITYQQWVDKVFSLYVERGVNRKRICDAIGAFKPTAGSHETLQELKARGKKVAVISGSLSIVLEKAFPGVQFDYSEINEVYFDEAGNITGWKATPYGDGKYKALGLMDIAEREGISLGNCVYVGDGENDMYAVEAAGLGIAFSPRNGLKMVCDVEIDAPFPYPANMKDVLRYVL